ncbi:MAG: dihydropteroate synthase, partial [Candidatus Omnitrophica bacterium]|nr:dihydropteroate synthase [Candidatus Omnitrophota bacterium]
DAAIERKALLKDIKTTVFIFGSLAQLKKLSAKLKNQPFNLKEVANKVSLCLHNLDKKYFTFKAKNRMIKIKKPLICGIINLTNDSFSGDGLLKESGFLEGKLENSALKKCAVMVKNGAKMIDFGAESSRPYSKKILAKDEIKRLLPILRIVRKEFKDLIISVDTYKYSVAKQAADVGIDIINDITALRNDSRMVKLIKSYRLGCVLMHMKGSPQTMQIKPIYKDVIAEIIDFFQERIGYCLANGINESSIFIDPGICFGKRLEDNTTILKGLNKFKILGLPIFLGLSRKSFIGKIINRKPQERLIGTLAATVIAVMQGAKVLRVHDVGETMQTLKVVSSIMNN